MPPRRFRISAQIAHTRGDYEHAEQRYREVLRDRARPCSPADPALGDYLYNLAVLLHERGQYGEAEKLYDEALANNRAAFGDDHPEVATVLVALRRLYRDLGEEWIARAAASRRLARSPATLWRDPHGVRLSHGEPRRPAQDQGEARRGPSLLEQAIAIYRARLPHAHAWLAGALRSLGETLTLEGRPVDARSRYESLAIWEECGTQSTGVSARR